MIYTERCKSSIYILYIQLILCLFFLLFVQYEPQANASDPGNSIGPVFGGFNQKENIIQDFYSTFQDVHVMIFIGFGFLMTFLKRYGFSAVGFNFLLGSLAVQWAILCDGFFNLNDNYKIQIGIESLYKADIAAATVLISMGALLGTTSYFQLLLMSIVEIAVFTVNSYIGSEIFKASDVGGSMYVHSFGAYFGLAVSFILNKKSTASSKENALEESRYTSDLFAMIGSIFLWLFWPSFNAIEVEGDDQHRAIINTYLSLASCCVTTFAISMMMSEDRKFNMVHIQNSTLAGGVAVGTSANLMLQPYGAIIVGMLAAALSVFGYSKLTPYLKKNLGIPDTCGVHNLHGMPGVFAGIVGIIMAGAATEATYYKSLYDIYPARASPNLTHNPEFNNILPGDGRNAGQQAGYQAVALIFTLLIAIVSGLITGYILAWDVSKPLNHNNFFNDSCDWKMPTIDKSFTTSWVIYNPKFKQKKVYGVF